MAAVTHGMNPDEVENLGRTLQRKADELRGHVSQLEGLVNNTGWMGKDASDFKGPWWTGHKKQLLTIAEGLHGFGQSALNNAREQREVSGR